LAAWLRRVVLGAPLAFVAVTLYRRGHYMAFYAIGLVGTPAIEVVVRLLESPTRKRGETWPIAQAHVESWDVKPIGGGEYGYYRGEVAYSYAVNSEFWPGFCARDFDTESEAWAFVDALKGKTVLVNYRPDKHDVSALTDSALRAAIPDPSVLRERRLLRIPALDWLWGWLSSKRG
jgi:hypothetical protein